VYHLPKKVNVEEVATVVAPPRRVPIAAPVPRVPKVPRSKRQGDPAPVVELSDSGSDD
jgi:hypothetical protein